jgi:hypothetical protein
MTMALVPYLVRFFKEWVSILKVSRPQTGCEYSIRINHPIFANIFYALLGELNDFFNGDTWEGLGLTVVFYPG